MLPSSFFDLDSSLEDSVDLDLLVGLGISALLYLFETCPIKDGIAVPAGGTGSDLTPQEVIKRNVKNNKIYLKFKTKPYTH